MAVIREVNGTPTNNPYLNSMVWGGRLWGPGANGVTTISYWFGDPDAEYNAAVIGRGGDDGYFGQMNGVPQREYWDQVVPEGQDHEDAVYSIFYALSLYSSVCNLKFVEAQGPAQADMVWWKTDLDPLAEGFAGLHEVLGASGNAVEQNRTQIWGYLNAFSPSWEFQGFGGDGLNTIIHEIGHGLGLAHPHDGGDRPDGDPFPGVVDGSTGTFGLNQSVYTVMSYNPGLEGTPYTAAYGLQGGLGAFDIAALQLLYGVNRSTATGSNTYVLPKQNALGTGWSCIWDAGGTDTIAAGATYTGVTIDLRAATLRAGDPNAGGYISMQDGIAGGFTIANGVVIENALGGLGADVLIGNAVKNTLKGNGGGDILAGGTGNDLLYGGTGKDGFMFAESPTSKNRDKIADFKRGQDKIFLDNDLFKKIGKEGKLKSKYFSLGEPDDKNDYIIYSKSTLYYDKDGSGHKSDPMAIVSFSHSPKLKYSDILVF